MILAFTICSVNYLAQARTLGDSLRQTNPDWQFIIGLVDDLATANLPAELVPAYPMIEVASLGIPDFAGMCDRYDITELNTAVKPFFIEFLFDGRHAPGQPKPDSVIYFDPDIIVFQPLNQLAASLKNYSLVVTPHTVEPTPDWETPNEQHHLNTGIFNLGFIGLRNDDIARSFVHWWQQRLTYECRIDLCAGLFVDQQWVNFAPIYYPGVLVEKHRGYNVAYWNVHERILSEANGTWLVTGVRTGSVEPLQFFHYSGYGVQKPDAISKYQTRYTFAQRPDLVPLFRLYHDRLIENGNDAYRVYPCVYIKPQPVLYYTSIRRLLNAPVQRLRQWIG
ncbi:glycosyl transferase [Fibrella sp. HMF5335]|uniref:Glycosyl transferase n=1 Tax=Fibrella rubiginis TaxID=2817060 RepID=A0A939GFN6_9BACT|nr:glycosyl transferase [Fibrella rubiginis]MBO0936928.1 glycosyl transferase [Fibrella rubiginis]